VRQSLSESLLRRRQLGYLAIMVNGPLPGMRPICAAVRALYVPLARARRGAVRQSVTRHASIALTIAVNFLRRPGFAQILGKLDFFNLGENLQLILFDYVEKRASTANAPFNRAC